MATTTERTGLEIRDLVRDIRTSLELICPARESRQYLCGRVASYQIEGTRWCQIHARRIMEAQMEESVPFVREVEVNENS